MWNLGNSLSDVGLFERCKLEINYCMEAFKAFRENIPQRGEEEYGYKKHRRETEHNAG